MTDTSYENFKQRILYHAYLFIAIRSILRKIYLNFYSHITFRFAFVHVFTRLIGIDPICVIRIYNAQAKGNLKRSPTTPHPSWTS